MKKYCSMVLVMALILPAMLFTVSCATKRVESTAAVSELPSAVQPSTPEADAARIEAERLREQQAREQQEREQAIRTAERTRFVNEDIHFEFDSSAIMPGAQKILSEKADYMRANPGMRVTIEGHCDDRGTDAYNMALGQRRADAARDYLIRLGIDGSRLGTISYGEERPIASGNTEEAWAKNRRAHFVIN
jgi:peptidoglycan-associated lipoprotein